MKGITPVIAIILLLLITVSMAGFAFVFLQRTLEQTTESTENNLANQLSAQGQTFVIDNVDDLGNNITVRHTGSSASDTSRLTVYINNTPSSCIWTTNGVWVPGGNVRGCSLPAFTCPNTIRLTAPGGTNSISC